MSPKKKPHSNPKFDFISVKFSEDEYHLRGLYDLLKERTKDESISHEKMPTYEQHLKFVFSAPYRQWYIIQSDNVMIGAIYETQNNEIGISIFKKYRRKGFAKAAIEQFFQWACVNTFYANINPKNTKSIKLFESLGFSHIQNTYKLKRV